MLEERVKNLESSSYENSKNIASPAEMRKSASNKSLKFFKEEAKQMNLDQSRRTDAIESSINRLQKEINAVKSQVSVNKKAIFSDIAIKSTERKFEIMNKNVGTMIILQETQEKNFLFDH